MTTDGTNASAGAFSCQVSSLNENTTYYYKAYVLEYNAATQEYEERFADEVKSFTTTAQTALVPGYWLEIPSYTTSAMAGTTTSSLTDLYPHTLYATMNGATVAQGTVLDVPAGGVSLSLVAPGISSAVSLLGANSGMLLIVK